jgi:hypothetical protein
VKVDIRVPAAVALKLDEFVLDKGISHSSAIRRFVERETGMQTQSAATAPRKDLRSARRKAEMSTATPPMTDSTVGERRVAGSLPGAKRDGRGRPKVTTDGVYVTTMLPRALVQEIKRRAEAEGSSMVQVLRRLLEDGLS